MLWLLSIIFRVAIIYSAYYLLYVRKHTLFLRCAGKSVNTDSSAVFDGYIFLYKAIVIGFLYVTVNNKVFSRTNIFYIELNNLAVLPEYRHLGIGKELVDYAIAYSKNTIGANKISIGIIEENSVLKECYEKIGFVHTGTQKFEHLPFTVGFMEIEI